MTDQPIWFPCLVNGEDELRLPFGLPLKKGAFGALLIKYFADFPDQLIGKYIVPVHTRSETARAFMKDWSSVIQHQMLPKLPTGWRVSHWKSNNQRQWEFNRKKIEEWIKLAIDYKIHWIYDYKPDYMYFQELGHAISEFYSPRFQAEASAKITKTAGKIGSELGSLIPQLFGF